ILGDVTCRHVLSPRELCFLLRQKMPDCVHRSIKPSPLIKRSLSISAKPAIAAFRDWNDMVYRKRNVLPGFIGVAILTQKLGTLANLRLNRGGKFTRHRLTLGDFVIARHCG